MDLAGTGVFRSGILWAGLREKNELEKMSLEVREVLPCAHYARERLEGTRT